MPVTHLPFYESPLWAHFCLGRRSEHPLTGVLFAFEFELVLKEVKRSERARSRLYSLEHVLGFDL